MRFTSLLHFNHYSYGSTQRSVSMCIIFRSFLLSAAADCFDDQVGGR